MAAWFGLTRWVARWMAVSVVLALVAPTLTLAQDEEKPSPRPSARFKAAKAAKAKAAKSGAKSDDKDQSADDEEAMEDKEEANADEGGEEFGGARKDRPSKAAPKSAAKAAATKRVKEKTTAKDKDEKLSKDDREKAKRIKAIEKMLGDEKEGFFVLRVSESKWVERKFEAPPEGGAAAGATAPQGQPGGSQNQLPFEEKVDTKFHILSGRQKAAEFIDDFMGDQAKPAKKPKTKRKPRADEQEAFELPPPVRDWEVLDRFPTGAEGNVAAQQLRDEAKRRYEQQWEKK